MTPFPREPSSAGTLAEWEAYRRKIAAFPVGEPGREGLLATTDAMIAAIQREEAEAQLPIAA